MAGEPINYNYLITSIVFLLLVILYLRYTKQVIKNNTSKTLNSPIKVLTLRGKIYMESGSLETDIQNIKDNIIKLSKDLDNYDCSDLKTYINKAKIHTKLYIEKNDINKQFCNKYDLTSNVLKEKYALKENISKKITRDDIDSDNDDNNDNDVSDGIKYDLLELISDIDIILFLIKSSLCTKDILNLPVLDQIIMELYKKKCSSGVNTLLSTPQMLEYNKGDDYYEVYVNSQPDVNQSLVSNSVASHDMTETELTPLKETFKIKPINNNNTRTTHFKNKPFIHNKIRLGKTLDCSNMSSLEWRRKYDLSRKNDDRIDKQTKSCLLNDYAYLDS